MSFRAFQRIRSIAAAFAVVLAAAIGTAQAGAQSMGPVRLTAGDGRALVADTQVTMVGWTLHRELAPAHAAARRYADAHQALADGYVATGGCTTATNGGRGVRFVLDELASEATARADEPTALLYEPTPDGSLRFVALEYAVHARAWHDAGRTRPPHLFDRPFTLEMLEGGAPWYVLRVWVGSTNPTGVFAGWHPGVTCVHSPAVDAAFGIADDGSGERESTTER